MSDSERKELEALRAENAALKQEQGAVRVNLRSYIYKKGARAGQQGYSLELTGGIFGSGFGYGQSPQWWARVVPHFAKIQSALQTAAVKDAIAQMQAA